MVGGQNYKDAWLMADELLNDRSYERGPIGWMVRNRVTPNIIMMVCLAGGLFIYYFQIKKEDRDSRL